MFIQKMSQDECLKFLTQLRFGRLACAHENQPYVIPIYFVYRSAIGGEQHLYGFTTLGQKVHWMRSNPLVCVEWDEVASYNCWKSIVAFGRYEELTETPEPEQELLHIQRLLQEEAVWWQPGSSVREAETQGETHFFIPIYYRIRMDRITGYRASPDAVERATEGVPVSPVQKVSWVRKALRRVTRMISR
jgi:uncharacterized protein